MSRRGVSVAALGRTLSNLETTAGLATGAPVVPYEVDVSDNNAVVAAFATLRSKLGEPTILINNAAVYPRRDFLAGTPEEFMECVAINLGGAVNCAHAALLSMTSTGRGRIINVGSFADISPQPMAGAYSVSKGAVGAFSRALVADLGDRFPDIVVSTWMPGILATQMGLATGLDPAIAARWGVELAFSNDRDLNGAVFERDLQILAPRSFKRRMLERLLRRSTKVRRLAPASAEQVVESQAG
jgi:NAD(P)-dependent dehydrogenase (short-subunit alcohol dehydrogenase family)